MAAWFRARHQVRFPAAVGLGLTYESSNVCSVPRRKAKSLKNQTNGLLDGPKMEPRMALGWSRDGLGIASGWLKDSSRMALGWSRNGPMVFLGWLSNEILKPRHGLKSFESCL